MNNAQTQAAPLHGAPLVISDTAIRIDQEGRFCINDLHKAAVGQGANKRTKEPSKFFASTQTIELVSELKRETTRNLGNLPVVTIKGRVGGTFVVKELVYAYAMWISPAFHIQVIRAYDALMSARVADPGTSDGTREAKPFEKLSVAKIQELRKFGIPKLVSAYLIECGVTPIYVSALLKTSADAFITQLMAEEPGSAALTNRGGHHG